MELADLEGAIPLFAAQLREHDIHTSIADLNQAAHAIIDNPSLGFLLLARNETTLVGFSYAASHLSLEHGGIIGWLEELYVIPEWRRRGVGSQLLTETILRAEKLKWRTLELEVVTGHERVIPLYLRHGFQPTSRIRYTRRLEI